MINLGGLLFRVQVDSDRSQFVMIPKMLKELVPADQMKSMSPEDWKKVKEDRGRTDTDDMSIRLRKWKSIFWGDTGEMKLLHDWDVHYFSICFFSYLQHIISSYNKQSGITVEEAKIAFLRAISSWPTFGCAFFEVKVSHQDEVKMTDKNLRKLSCHL